MSSVTKNITVLREVVKKSKWKFKMAFAIRGPTPFAIESYIYETDFTLQKYHFEVLL